MRCRRAAASVVAGLLVAGCGSGSARPTTAPSTQSPGGVPECPSAPYQPRATAGDAERQPLPAPALDDVRAGRFVTSLVLDDALHVDPPRADDKARYPGDDAVCAVLASTSSNNFPIGRQSADTIAVGLARVTVPDGLLHHSALGDVTSHGSVDGVADVNPDPPAPAAYHDRLAWVAVVAPVITSSCPAMTSGATSSQPGEAGHHGYQVFVVDAATGGDALLYTERRNDGCGSGRAAGPWVDVPLTSVSVPWQLESEEADRSSAQVSFEVTPCDGYSGVILVDERDQPVVGRVVVQRPFGPPCGSARRITEKMRIATIGKRLPAHLAHAPVGPSV